MICKKCGANIADTSKFCTYCGSKVELENNLNEELSNNLKIVDNTPKPIETTESNVVQTNIESTVNQGQNLNQNNNLEQTVVVPQVNEQPVQPTLEPKKKKNNTWIFIVGGIVLALIAILLVFVAINKSSNSSIKDLEKALNNIYENGENSGTINTKVLIETDTSDTYNLSALIKYAKQNDNYDIDLTLNKSMLYDEMNFYATITDKDVTLFANSSLIDMLGFTSSPSDMWVYFLMTSDELDIDLKSDNTTGKIDLSSVLDKEHYKFIAKENGLDHYQLTIDNYLLNKIKSLAPSKDELDEFEESLSEITSGSTDLIDVYYVDIYINDVKELVKVSMDLTDKIDDESVKKAVVSFEFEDFGNTIVQIPSEAKSAIIDLETYMSNYALIDNSYDDIDYQDDNYDEYNMEEYYNYIQ